MKNIRDFCAANRTRLIEIIKTNFVPQGPWVLVLINDFEDHRNLFRAESSFFYLTGITEPGTVVCIYSDGRTIVYQPDYSVSRELWMGITFNPEHYGFDQAKMLGEKVPGYTLGALFNEATYSILGNDLSSFLNDQGTLLVLYDKSGNRYKVQAELMNALVEAFNISYAEVRDISPLVHEFRREKRVDELVIMHDAASITVTAQRFAARAIKAGVYEYEVRAAVESVFLMMGSERPAFPTIVGAGINSTKLHYSRAGAQLRDGEVVLIDCGAEYQMYASDVTRTYPVSGMFTPRQREVYQIVLDVQNAIEKAVRPGMFLSNPAAPEMSLHHMAVKMFTECGMGAYFPHGLGHFLGLDTHDVGDRLIPLASGDVFTIEPGLYLPEEQLGIRIEDDYVLTDDGIVCLSADLPKKVDELEAMLAESA